MKLKVICVHDCRTDAYVQCFSTKAEKYYVAKPGTLVELMTEAEITKSTQLTLQGKLNAIDFRHLRDEFKNLRYLDISNASISMYAGKTALIPTVFISIPPIASRPMPSAKKSTTALSSASL